MDEIIRELLSEIKKPTSLSKPELQKFLYREMIRLTVLINPNLSEPQIFGRMSAFVKKAKYQVNGDSDEERLHQLLELFYKEWAFCCDYKEYFYTDSLLLDRVMTKRYGMPVSLGALLLYIAAVLDLPLYPVNFTTQLILRAELKTEKGRIETRFINPWNGDYLSTAQLEKWLEGEQGFGVELTPELLRIAEPNELLERVETVFKMALTREGKYEETLRLIEYRLTISPEDPYEIRDRGMVLASMNCFQAALEDINYFIDQCPDDPSASVLKLELPSLERQSKACIVH